MLENLTARLSRIVKTIRGEARLTEANVQEALREVRVALLEADVALPVVKELTRLMGEAHVELNLAVQPPAVILMAGLQGSGKTTTTGKLARLLREEQRKKVLVVSCDVYRPAAIEQLRTVAAQAGVDFLPSEAGEAPAAIARRAREQARLRYFDVLIVDSAGRLAVDADMMREITELESILQPAETLFVVDAMQGQDAVNVARAFGAALPLTGVVLTKLDGDARGGAALSVREVTGKPIKYVGTGEKLAGLEPFHPERMASRILGMGDILSLVEAAHKQVDLDEAKRVAEKIKRGKGFDLEDFKQQLQQMKKMGGLAALADKLPAQLASQISPAQMQDDTQFRRIEGIINAMTPQERARPELIKASRKRRIATGSGVPVQEVNRLLNQFEQMQKMMKLMKGGNLGRMMRGMRGMLPGMR
jgi:signal recognition particle subunit SRP54